MSIYRRNILREETIARCGETVGLPLFESVSKKLREPLRSRFEHAPKSIPVATDTRKLSRITQLQNVVDLSDKQQLVLDAFIELGPSTNTEIAWHLKKESGWVSARNNELREFGYLVDAGKRPCRITGMIVHEWKAKLPGQTK
jgi:hypothetical protein